MGQQEQPADGPGGDAADLSAPASSAHRAEDRAGEDRIVPRQVVDDATGAVWAVRERDCAGEPGCRAPRCLCFAGDAAVRRVWRYPAGWAALPDAALLALMAARVDPP